MRVTIKDLDDYIQKLRKYFTDNEVTIIIETLRESNAEKQNNYRLKRR